MIPGTSGAMMSDEMTANDARDLENGIRIVENGAGRESRLQKTGIANVNAIAIGTGTKQGIIEEMGIANETVAIGALGGSGKEAEVLTDTDLPRVGLRHRKDAAIYLAD
jgi:hypothetical protein